MIKFQTQKQKLSCGPTAVVNLLITQPKKFNQRSEKAIARGVKFKVNKGTFLKNINSYLKRIGLRSKVYNKVGLRKIKQLSKDHDLLVLIHHEDFSHFFTVVKMTPKGMWTTNNAHPSYKTYKDLRPLYWIKNQEIKKFYKVLTIPKKV